MKKKKLLIATIIGIILISVILAFSLKNNTKKNDVNNKNENETEKSATSFRMKMLSMNSMNLSEDEKLVLEYFDNSYTRLTSSLTYVTQKYTNLFKNMKLYVEGYVVSIIESDDQKYKAIVKLYDDNYDVVEDDKHYCIIEGEQQVKRFKKGDYVAAYGTYETSELTSYNGEEYLMPKIKTEKWDENGARFSNDEVRKISKYIFGENIRFDNIKGCVYNVYCEDYPLAGYLVKLENPKNPNYTMFNVFRGGQFIEVGYCNEENYEELCSSTQQVINVAYDYKHFIILTYEKATETAYMEYYDREFNKIWRKELDKEGSINESGVRAYYDYNNKYLTFVMDGYLYLIDLTDGTDVISPVLIGADHEILMCEDYILLIGYEKKDYIIKLNYNGKIEKKISIEDSEITKIHSNKIQLIDDKIVVMISGENKEGQVIYKVLKLNEKLNIEVQSDDII